MTQCSLVYFYVSFNVIVRILETAATQREFRGVAEGLQVIKLKRHWKFHQTQGGNVPEIYSLCNKEMYSYSLEWEEAILQSLW